VDWTQLSRDTVHWSRLMNAVMSLRVSEDGEFIDQTSDCLILENNSAVWN
jgi:hypothetical protein